MMSQTGIFAASPLFVATTYNLMAWYEGAATGDTDQGVVATVRTGFLGLVLLAVNCLVVTYGPAVKEQIKRGVAWAITYSATARSETLAGQLKDQLHRMSDQLSQSNARSAEANARAMAGDMLNAQLQEQLKDQAAAYQDQSKGFIEKIHTANKIAQRAQMLADEAACDKREIQDKLDDALRRLDRNYDHQDPSKPPINEAAP